MVPPIDIETIPHNEINQALKEFADGSKALEECLKIMWLKELKTHACSPGDDDQYNAAYISMTPGADLFSYLSKNTIENENIVLELYDNQQVIRIYGQKEIKETLLKCITNDISTGIKEDKALLKNKLISELDKKLFNELKFFAGMSDEEIKARGEQINYILDNGTEEEVESIMPEFYEYVRYTNQRLIERNTTRKK